MKFYKIWHWIWFGKWNSDRGIRYVISFPERKNESCEKFRETYLDFAEKEKGKWIEKIKNSRNFFNIFLEFPEKHDK